MKTLTEVVVKSHRLELLHRIADAYRTTGLFNSIIPTPPDFKSHPREWQMEWMLENWNTLHEIIQNDDWVSITAPGVLSVRIMTMWNCPFPFLDKLVELGCDIHGRTATTDHGLLIYSTQYDNGVLTEQTESGTVEYWNPDGSVERVSHGFGDRPPRRVSRG